MARRVVYRRFGSGGAPDVGGLEVQSPARTPEVGADFLVPLAQSAVTGLLAGVALALLLSVWLHFGFWDIVPITIVAGLLVAWMWRLAATHETLWRVDMVVQDQDPKPAVDQAHILPLNPYQGQQNQATEAVDRLRQQFLDFVLACDLQGDCSLRKWERRLGRAKYAEFRDALIGSGFAAWINPRDPRAGWRLTGSYDTVRWALEGGSFKLPGVVLAEST